MKPAVCRSCGEVLRESFCDLGLSPLSNSFVAAASLRRPETFFPLHALVCEKCFLVQLEAYEAPENIFSDYLYFSSFSDTWLEHARNYARYAIDRFALTDKSLVVEVASNDGYLLKNFVQAQIPVLGVEPAENVARVAEAAGVPTLTRFFGTEVATALARQGKAADLIVGNNVLAHVPDLNDFVEGLRIALKPHGTITLEFPHLLQLIRGVQFDTIYHEHFSYLSLFAIETLFARHGLDVVDIQELQTHGGSLRVFATHAGRGMPSSGVEKIRRDEEHAGLRSIATYRAFAPRVEACKDAFLQFLLESRRGGKLVVGYGAPAKGNTLLNYCGVKSDLLQYTVDRSPHKQGRFLPGTRIPIHAPERIFETRPDYVVILPWNLRGEIAQILAPMSAWGGKLVTAIPSLEVWSPG